MPERQIIYKDALNRSDIVLGPLLNHAEDVLLIGNGDIQAIIKRTNDQIIMNLSKNNIWDRRLDTSQDSDLITTQDLLEEVSKYTSEGDWNPETPMCCSQEFARKVENSDLSYEHPYPCPLVCTSVLIHAAVSSLECYHLSLEEGTVYCHIDHACLRIYADANANGYLIEGIPDEMIIELSPIQQMEMESPVTGQSGDVSWIKQRMPPDLDIPEMNFIVLLSRDYENKMAYITAATSKDAQACCDESHAILTKYQEKRPGEIHSAHRQWWSDYWSKSGIRLQDEFLEAAWYRELYFLACAARTGKTAPALFMGMTEDHPMWHGDYHLNINMQMCYWGCYAANHDELGEPYDSFIAGNLNRSIWLAEKLFDVEGAFYCHFAFLDEPRDPASCRSKNGRQSFHHVWSRTLGVSAFAAQNLWWHYLFTQDQKLLERVYPVIRQVSMFYVNWGRLYPTVSPEHWGIAPNLKYNNNSTFDICLVKFILNAAIKASLLLDKDQVYRQRWSDFIATLPAYPVSDGDDPVVVDVEGAPPIPYNLPVPLFPVFPGEDFTAVENFKQLFIRTANQMTFEFYDPIIPSMARLRLHTEDAFDSVRLLMKRSIRPNGSMSVLPEFHPYSRFVYSTQECGLILPITELLLQSHGGIIRLFPSWKRDLAASFSSLRAVGAFIVSSSIENGVVGKTVIRSLAGGQVKLVSEWEKPNITDERMNFIMYCHNSDGLIIFDTQKDRLYIISEDIPCESI